MMQVAHNNLAVSVIAARIKVVLKTAEHMRHSTLARIGIGILSSGAALTTFNALTPGGSVPPRMKSLTEWDVFT
jgi:hypothetical protein